MVRETHLGVTKCVSPHIGFVLLPMNSPPGGVCLEPPARCVLREANGPPAIRYTRDCSMALRRRFRIAVGGVAHETAGVLDGVSPPALGNPQSSTPSLASFIVDGAKRGSEMTVDSMIGTTVSGYLQGCAEQNMEALPTLFASGASGGPVTSDTLRAVIDELVEATRAVLPVDGLLVALHGSFAAQGVDDADGEVLKALRSLVGPSVPIYAALDQHCNVSQLMVDNADVLSIMRTYPHIDGAERALRCAELLHDALCGTAVPEMAWCSIPLLWHPQRMLSGQAPYQDLVSLLEEIAPSHTGHQHFSSAGDMWADLSAPMNMSTASDADSLLAMVADFRGSILDVSVGVGYQWIDSPTVGACSIAVVDALHRPSTERGLTAQALADELASLIWARRSHWTAPSCSVEQAIAEAEAMGRFPSILADGGDNTGGGAPGDGTAILRRFLRSEELWPCCMLYIVDPSSAAAAHAAGVGAEIDIAVGGTSHPRLGPPAQMKRATVEAVSDGKFVYDSSKRMRGAQGDLGTTALLRERGTYVVVVSKPTQPMDMALCTSLGLDCRQMRYICVKSTGHFRDGFERIAGSIFNVDHAETLFTFNFAQLEFRRFGRPLFPINDAAELSGGAVVAPEGVLRGARM
eukprot:COSAG02_NODE_953_length_15689_cov_112.180564_12_plen_634_part_00